MRILILINSLYGTKFRSKITNSKISKNFSYKKKRKKSAKLKKNKSNITNNIFIFLNMHVHVDKLKIAFKHVN